VIANNTFGSSAASAASNPATPSCTNALGPDQPHANAGQGQITLNWSAVSGATGYNVKRDTVGGGSKPTVRSVVTNMYTDTGPRRRHHVLLRGHGHQLLRREPELDRGVGDPDRHQHPDRAPGGQGQ
jgi:hypothetical protein